MPLASRILRRLSTAILRLSGGRRLARLGILLVLTTLGTLPCPAIPLGIGGLTRGDRGTRPSYGLLARDPRKVEVERVVESLDHSVLDRLTMDLELSVAHELSEGAECGAELAGSLAA